MKRRAFSIVAACAIALMSVDAGVNDSHAQQPSSPPAPKARPAPKLDAEALRLPDSIHRTNVRPIDKPRTTLPPPGPPNKVDLGKYDLEFRAKHSTDVNPRTGYDSGEKSNLSNTAVGRRGDSSLPNYFGLKLSTPTD